VILYVAGSRVIEFTRWSATLPQLQLKLLMQGHRPRGLSASCTTQQECLHVFVFHIIFFSWFGLLTDITIRTNLYNTRNTVVA
jgi:hypothetical protein